VIALVALHDLEHGFSDIIAPSVDTDQLNSSLNCFFGCENEIFVVLIFTQGESVSCNVSIVVCSELESAGVSLVLS